MAIIGNIAIGMSVGTSGLTKGFGVAKGAVKSFADSVVSIQGLAAGVFGGAAATGIYKLASQFSHLSEATSKTDAVFKNQADNVKASAKAMAEAYGMSYTEILDKQSLMGAMFSGSGFSNEAAANFSDVFTRLANDMTRRWDVLGGTGEALDQLMSALRGTTDALDKYGAGYTAAEVENRAYAMGLAKVGQELSEGAKKQARATIIMDRMKSAIGGASSEVGSFGANAEALAGRWENFTTVMGESFAPTLTTIMGDLGVFLKVLKDGWEDNRKGVQALATDGLGDLEGFASGVGIVQGAVMKLADGWQVVRLSFVQAQAYINAGMVGLIRGLRGFKDIIDELSGKNDIAATGAFGMLTGRKADGGDFLEDWANELDSKIPKLFEGLQAEWAKPWSSEGIAAAFAKAKGQIADMQAALAAKPMDLMKTTGAKGTADKLMKEGKPYGAAVLAGSAEAAKAIARARFGGGNTVEKNTAATVRRLDQLIKLANKQMSARNDPPPNIVTM